MKKNWGTTLIGGRVSRQKSEGEGGGCNLFSFKKTLIRHFEKYLHTMMVKLTKHVGITIFLLYKQKTRWNSDIQNFYSEIFAFFTQNIAIFRSGIVLWRHNYITPKPIVLILVCISREGPYLPIDTKINFIGGSVWKSRCAMVFWGCGE